MIGFILDSQNPEPYAGSFSQTYEMGEADVGIEGYVETHEGYIFIVGDSFFPNVGDACFYFVIHVNACPFEKWHDVANKYFL